MDSYYSHMTDQELAVLAYQTAVTPLEKALAKRLEKSTEKLLHKEKPWKRPVVRDYPPY